MSNEFVVGAFVAAMAAAVAWNLWRGRKGARKPAGKGAAVAGTGTAVSVQGSGDAAGGACGPSGSDGACGGGDGA